MRSRTVALVLLACLTSMPAHAQRIDPSIALSVRPPQFDSPLALMQQAAAIRAAKEQAELTAAQRRLTEAQTQGVEAENARRASVTQGAPPVAEIPPELRDWLRAIRPRQDLYPDFASVVYAPDVPISNDMIRLMSGSSYAADIAYYLGKHKIESRAVRDMPLLDAARAIEDIESRVKPKQ